MTIPDIVKRTTGGRYDPADRFIYFLASSPAYLEGVDASIAPNVLVAVNELGSDGDRRAFENMLRQGKRILLDSGIFSLANEHAHRHGMTHNEALNLSPQEVDGFDRLLERYIDVVNRYRDDLWGIIELDQGGRRNKVVTRAMLEKEIPGFVPIPVYHPVGDGWEYFDELATHYDRICCGNIVQAPPPDRIRLMHAFYERAKRHPHLWTHILGYTPTGTSTSIPAQGSCDSSSWCGPLRWGVDSTKCRSMNTPLGHFTWDEKWNRNHEDKAHDTSGYDAMKRWAAYRANMMTRAWRDIEARKETHGLTTRGRNPYADRN
jgi:hypothetical protein